MAVKSKYQDQQFEQLFNDLIITIEKHKAPVDLSLMALGNLVTTILRNNTRGEQQQVLTDAFCAALKNSLNTK